MATAVCPSADDIAIAKLCAWRGKDQDWLREAFKAGIARVDSVAELLRTGLSPDAPGHEELARRLAVVAQPAIT